MSKIPDGWVPMVFTNLDDMIGPPIFRADGSKMSCGFKADERHRNRHDVVHGGVITSVFDIALGTACQEASGDELHATVQLNVQFVGPMHMGDFGVIRSELVRSTRSLVFMRGIMTVGERVIAAGDGIWKILRPSK